MRGLLGALTVALVILPATAEAYVGPGAGIALLTTVGALLIAIVAGLVSILLWPLRWVWRRVRQKTPPQEPKIKRAVIIGLDGLDPDLTRRFMDAGRLPNMQRLAEAGSFNKLGTTCPAMSPVAWSSFATGVHPSKHGIYDFLTRDPNSYLPDLSSTHIAPPEKNLDLGGWRIPLGKPVVKLLRKSTSFWKLLSRYGIPSSILRVPITFPPETFDGTMLSAMCVPDLQGSQGTFTFLTSDTAAAETIGGNVVQVKVEEGVVEAVVLGPENPLKADGDRLEMPIRLEIHGKSAELEVSGTKLTLLPGEYSDWTEVAFPMGLGMKLRGICRFRLIETYPTLRLYMSPINIDPARPVMPISQPFVFAVFLAKLIGRYATLGLAEDTWALNDGVIDEDAFLEQAWANHAEREAMLFEMLERTPRGVITCVFDGTDRIQHMFMRYLDEGHPAAAGRTDHDQYRTVIEDTYARMDEMVGRVIERVGLDDPQTMLAVMSDHGFKTFRRGVNLNSWLLEKGYLVLEDGRTETGEWFEGVDWTRTRAFALGLSGVFLNIKGRERDGVIDPGEPAHQLAQEIAEALTGLVDDGVGDTCVDRAYAAKDIYDGPYADRAPDIIVGYSAGWRASWDSVRGIANDVKFDDNTRAWSGDHCIEPRLVPGVLIANRPLSEGSIVDMAPTLLELFGIPAPRYMDGVSLT